MKLRNVDRTKHRGLYFKRKSGNESKPKENASLPRLVVRILTFVKDSFNLR